MANTNKYSKNDVAIVEVLKANPDGLTLAEINEKTGLNLVSAHVVGTMKKGLVAVVGSRDVERKTLVPRTVYNYVTSEVTKNAEGKENSYTPNEVKVLAAIAEIGHPFILAELAAAMGKEKMSSGSVNGLVKKGNLTKDPEMRKVEVITTKPNNVYGFVKDIPADAAVAN